MDKKFSGKAKVASVVAGILAAAGLGFLWGKKRNDTFEIDEFTIDPENIDIQGGAEPEETEATEEIEETEENGDEISSDDEIQDTENTVSEDDEETDGRININTATVDELNSISGIGSSKAENIVKYREENGNFEKVEDLLNVHGIERKKLESISEYITV